MVFAIVLAASVGLTVRLAIMVRRYHRGAAYLGRVIDCLAARITELETENREVVSNINHIAFAPSALGDIQPDIRA